MATAKPEQGPLNPAFVEALHDPLVGIGLGRLPSPVEVHVGAAAEARAARFAAPPSYDLRTEGRLSAVKDQRSWNTCWAFANTAALESKLMPASPEPDFSEDNVVRRSGYFSTMDQRYDWGGWDFMAVAYFARWAGPVDESADPYDHAAGANGTRKHVQGVVMVPGRSHFTDNDLLKRLVLENGALSAGMYFDPDWSPYSEYTDDTGLHATYYSPQWENENHGVTIVGWDDAYPRDRFQGERRDAARETAPFSCATPGATTSARAATSGSPTTTARSPSTAAPGPGAGAPPTATSRTCPTTPASTSTTSSA